MKITNKLNKQITINFDEATYKQIDIIAQHYQRKPAELLRLLLIPILINQYVTIQRATHLENTQPLTQAIFNE